MLDSYQLTNLSSFRLPRDAGVHQPFSANFKVAFNSETVNKRVRRKQFNEVDFLSFVGGILGLFAGFSALSFVELIYWLIVRNFTKKCNKMTAKVHPESSSQSEGNLMKIYFESSSIHSFAYFINSNFADK